MRWSITVVGVFTLLLSGACSSSENSGNQGIGGAVANETPCQKLCRRAGQVSAACAPADCESKCETTLPQCDAEYRSYVECLANAQMLGCDSSNNPTAGGDCAGQQQSFQSCLLGGTGGAGGMGGAGGTGGTGGGGATGPCDPLAASCVGCGTGDPCGAGESCCYEDPTPSCKPTGSCGGIQASCDGAEDCPGAECCVQFVTQMDGSAKSGSTQCSAAGSTTCCSPTPESVAVPQTRPYSSAFARRTTTAARRNGTPSAPRRSRSSAAAAAARVATRAPRRFRPDPASRASLAARARIARA